MRLEGRALWALSLYPEAGEGGGCLSVPRSGELRGGRPDAMRAAEVAGRRAKGKLRRFCVTNGLNRLGTLTYKGEGCHDPLVLRADVAVFFRGIRDGLGGRLPYAWVPQWHPGGHGLHVHFAVGRFVPRSLIEESWRHGFVHIKLLSNLPVGSGPRAESRMSARYMSGYVGRDFEDGRRPAGLHRYEVAQGYQPVPLLVYGQDADDVIRRASEYMGSAPEYVWLSSTMEGWHAPPACWAQWA